METLKLEHLAGYLPYKLKGVINNDGIVREFVGWNYTSFNLSPSKHKFTHCAYEDVKPLLYPLSCLKEEIEVNGEKFNINLLPKNLRFKNEELQSHNVLGVTARTFNILLKFHFDVYGLIEKGLAIDKRTVKL